MKWKPVLNYEGIYEISENGDVKRIANTNNQYKVGHILKSNVINGYAHVQLHKNSKVKSMRVHRLVAISFIANPSKKPHVNHIDGNKLNNNLSNLEWCTPSENQLHKHRVLNRTFRKYVLSSEDLQKLIELRISGKRLNELSKMFNIPPSSLHNILKRNKIQTGYKGMFNGSSKLNDNDRKNIASYYLSGITIKELSEKYSVSIATIRRTLKLTLNEKTY
jgi:Mor family transcriptional regulator